MNLKGRSILSQTATYVSFMQILIWDFPSKFDLNQERHRHLVLFEAIVAKSTVSKAALQSSSSIEEWYMALVHIHV